MKYFIKREVVKMTKNIKMRSKNSVKYKVKIFSKNNKS